MGSDWLVEAGLSGNPEALLRGALEKIVYFECRLSQLESELSAARDVASREKESAAGARARETAAAAELARTRSELEIARHRESELSERVRLLEGERERFLTGLIDQARIAGAPGEEAPAGEEADLAGFIAELRAEIDRLRPWKTAAEAAGLRLDEAAVPAIPPHAAVGEIAPGLRGRRPARHDPRRGHPHGAGHGEPGRALALRVVHGGPGLLRPPLPPPGRRRAARHGLPGRGAARRRRGGARAGRGGQGGAALRAGRARRAGRGRGGGARALRPAPGGAGRRARRGGRARRRGRRAAPARRARATRARWCAAAPSCCSASPAAPASRRRSGPPSPTATPAWRGPRRWPSPAAPPPRAQGALARALDHGEESVRRVASTAVARWCGESVAAAAPAEDRRRAARRIAEKLSAVGATALRDAVVADPAAAPARAAAAAPAAPGRAAPGARAASATARLARAAVAVVEVPSGELSPGEEAVLLELRSALRGRTPEEIARVVPGGADRALAALVARGAAVKRGVRYFPA